jgi:hypothetical protein
LKEISQTYCLPQLNYNLTNTDIQDSFANDIYFEENNSKVTHWKKQRTKRTVPRQVLILYTPDNINIYCGIWNSNGYAAALAKITADSTAVCNFLYIETAKCPKDCLWPPLPGNSFIMIWLD